MYATMRVVMLLIHHVCFMIIISFVLLYPIIVHDRRSVTFLDCPISTRVGMPVVWHPVVSAHNGRSRWSHNDNMWLAAYYHVCRFRRAWEKVITVIDSEHGRRIGLPENDSQAKDICVLLFKRWLPCLRTKLIFLVTSSSAIMINVVIKHDYGTITVDTTPTALFT